MVGCAQEVERHMEGRHMVGCVYTGLRKLRDIWQALVIRTEKEQDRDFHNACLYNVWNL